jgi:hypothetical protein
MGFKSGNATMAPVERQRHIGYNWDTYRLDVKANMHIKEVVFTDRYIIPTDGTLEVRGHVFPTEVLRFNDSNTIHTDTSPNYVDVYSYAPSGDADDRWLYMYDSRRGTTTVSRFMVTAGYAASVSAGSTQFLEGPGGASMDPAGYRMIRDTQIVSLSVDNDNTDCTYTLNLYKEGTGSPIAAITTTGGKGNVGQMGDIHVDKDDQLQLEIDVDAGSTDPVVNCIAMLELAWRI